MKKYLSLLLISYALICNATDWSYDGNTGPEHWGDVNPEYSLCKTGKMQSPVNISGKIITKDLVDLNFKYRKFMINITSDDDLLKIESPMKNKLKLKDGVYRLLQFHFHTPSEYLINDQQYPMEIHFVHRKVGGENLAVVGVMVEEGDENPAIAKIIEAHAQPSQRIRLDSRDLLPVIKSYYNFKGSLTTPPCTEGVNWYVMDNPITASRQQLVELREIISIKNARPVQPLNDRRIIHFTE